MSASRLHDELIVHFTDFTKLKLLQFELLERVAQLKTSNEQLDEFTRAASHDLKEPIRKINVFTARLKSQLSGQLLPAHLETFEKIELAADRMRLLVDDLLQLSHVSHGIEQFETIDLSAILTIVQEDLELDIQQTQAVICVSPLPQLKAHRRQIQQLFQNLVSNAIKYSKAGVRPHVVVQSRPSVIENGRQYHVIEIIDNGIGFDQKYEHKIFELFSRLHKKNEYSGTGVGLTIVKKVMENHDGKIEVDSVQVRVGHSVATLIVL